MQGATNACQSKISGTAVSIHAPYAGSDDHIFYDGEYISIVSIHAPYAGSD